MSDKFDKLFKETNEYSLVKFENVDFSKVGRVHDWRNYVPDKLKEDWKDLTERERKLVFIIAVEGASREDWD